MGQAATLRLVRGAVEVRPFPAEKRPGVSMAQGLSGEAVNGEHDDGNP